MNIEVNKELVEKIKDEENKGKIFITGLEGCGKSKATIDAMLYGDIVDYEKEYVIYCTTTYEALEEKQEEIIKRHGLTYDQVPIYINWRSMQLPLNRYRKKLKPKSYTSVIKKDAKIVLMAMAAVKRCHHEEIPMDSELGQNKKINSIIIDEFDFTSCIIPRLDYLVHSAINKKDNIGSIKKFIEREYTSYDADEYFRKISINKDAFVVSRWLSNSERWGIKTIFVSSETIPRVVLEQLKYHSFEIGNKEYIEHTINYCKDKYISKYLFNRLNDENKWGIFGFNTIISDKYSDINYLDHEINIVSHISCRGRNTFEGNDRLLTIISHVPQNIHRAIMDAISYLGKTDETYETIKAYYYRDRLMQAVGRVIGYRGEKCDIKETWVIIHEDLMDNIINMIKAGKIKIKYSLKEWNFKSEEFDELKQRIIDDKRIDYNLRKQEGVKTKYIRKKTDANKEYARRIIFRTMEKTDNKNDVITNEELEKFFNSRDIKGIRKKFVAEQFGLKVTRVNTKKYNGMAIRYLRFKNKKEKHV